LVNLTDAEDNAYWALCINSFLHVIQ
jgi:hypothetical protein